MIIDSHAHLYTYNNIDEVVLEAKDAKVETIVSISTDIETSKLNIGISERYDNVFCAVGVHPCDIMKHSTSDLDKIEKLSKSLKNKAIGEIGLDFFHSNEYRKDQFEFFDLQIDIAQRVGLPFIVHARDSYLELIDYLSSRKIKSDFVVHCYTGDKVIAKKLLDLGSYISFTGIITFKKSNELRDVAEYVPNDKMMIETDSPYLSPHPNRGKTNYPKNLIYIAECIAEVKKIDLEIFSSYLKENTVKFYKL